MKVRKTQKFTLYLDRDELEYLGRVLADVRTLPVAGGRVTTEYMADIITAALSMP